MTLLHHEHPLGIVPNDYFKETICSNGTGSYIRWSRGLNETNDFEVIRCWLACL